MREALAIAVMPDVGVGLASATDQRAIATDDPAAVVAAIEARDRPRWVWWTNDTATSLIDRGVRVASCWDVAAVDRLLFGHWRADPARSWARAHALAVDDAPALGQLDLLAANDEGGDRNEPVRPDRYLRPEWASGGWATTPARLARWASAAFETYQRQRELLAGLDVLGDADATARSESAAELLCAELSIDGLPFDLVAANALLRERIGEPPTDDADAARLRRRRDDDVLSLVPASSDIDMRNPASVRTLLRRAGIEVPNTRAGRLERLRGSHPVVDALLAWRKAERIATTYGYGWLDANVGADGRLRGAWTGSDGAAGRMTAQAGLHNLPAELRAAVAAEPGHVFVRADLGQIEPRVLAAVSGDRALALATRDDDLYAPVAARLGVERAVAKVAFLAAMYGGTAGAAGRALHDLDAAYPTAMSYLRDADRAGREGRDVRTYGGRLVRVGSMTAPDGGNGARVDAASLAAARGRYARNAAVQGAAAELFKRWAVTVRARAAHLDARVVLCLHDELLVHTPTEHGDEVAEIVDASLHEAARRWTANALTSSGVRFVSATSIVARWSDAKSS